MTQSTRSLAAYRSISRRRFLQGTAAVGGLALLSPTAKVLGANERFNIAVCGVNSRGNWLMNNFAGIDGVHVSWIVDPDRNLLEQRASQMSQRQGSTPRTTTDVRDALDDPDVDAVIVGTPNHWHSLMVIWAAQAGKHCFVEKPASHDIYEGRVAYEAAKKYGVVVQHGTQSRCSNNWRALIALIHQGHFGRLAASHAFACKRRSGIGHSSPGTPPDHLDWNMWRGKAVIDQYHNNYVHYDWHWYWVTGNGDLNNQGTHQLDIAWWALDPEMHGRTPVRVMSLGGRFAWDDDGQTPNTQYAVAEYENGQKVLMNIRNVNYGDHTFDDGYESHDGYTRQIENRFYFEDGGIIVARDMTYVDSSGERHSIDLSGVEYDRMPSHLQAFVRACRDAGPNPCSMKEGHYSSALGHVMNLSYRLGEQRPDEDAKAHFESESDIVRGEFEKIHTMTRDGMRVAPEGDGQYMLGPWLTFNPDTERFEGDRANEANAMVADPRREEFDIPAPEEV